MAATKRGRPDTVDPEAPTVSAPAPPAVVTNPRREETFSDKALHESDSQDGPWTKCAEVPASKAGRRAWRVTKRFTALK